jgi:acetyl esterase
MPAQRYRCSKSSVGGGHATLGCATAEGSSYGPCEPRRVLDPQVRAYLDHVASLNPPPLESLPLPEARALFDQTFIRLGGAPVEVGSVEDVEAPGPAGPIPIRIYRPQGDQAPLPLLMFLHGGGYTCGSLDSYDALCRMLTRESGFVVASVGYRLAPEHPAPAPGEDAYAAFLWLAANASAFGAEAARLAVGGDSAGGGLAAGVALRARDSGGPPIIHQLLVYPAVGSEAGSASARAYGEGHGLTNARMKFYWECYVPQPELAQLPYVLADNASSLRGLPPATVIIAECDPLHDMGVAYAERLRADGVPVELHVYDGMIHAFFSYIAIFDKGRQAVGDAAAALRNAARTGVTT